MTPDHEMPAASRTDVGQRREHNEDSLLLALPVLAVADGVGGSVKGEVASQTAIDSFGQRAREIATARSSEDATRAMEAAVLAANSAVHDAQLHDDSLRGMATTITAAVVRDGGEVIVGHVGDSRLYVLSAAGARQVSHDHSVVAELVRSGRLEPAEATSHPQRNVITRALGPEADVSVDAFTLHVGPGDWLLLCSDGLTDHVEDHELAQTMLADPHDPEAGVAALVDLANARGGTDNITVVVAQPVPSDVSGELDLEALKAAVSQTAAIPPVGSGVTPAEESGPLPTVLPDELRDVEASGEMPAMQPLEHDDEDMWAPRGRRRGGGRGWLLLLALVVVGAAIGGFVWSQSYFLLERADGRVGINRGFPIARLATPYRSSDIAAEELTASDRERLVDSHRLLSRDDAERVLDELPQRVDGSLDEQGS
jgi:serine/threonine protein phosphatase PrpC